MIDLVKRFFSQGVPASPREGDAAGHDVRVATCALFLEMAAIDGEFSGPEKEKILAVLRREFGLDDDCARALMEEAEKERAGSIDLWRFAELINKNYTVAEKERVIETIWKIAFIDGTLHSHEDYLMHKLGTLLRLSHGRLIDLKLRAKRNPAEPGST